MRYVIDAANSEITWSGFIPGTSMSGRVLLMDGTVVTDEHDREINSGVLSIDMNSIEALDSQLDDGNKRKLAAHLRSADFFDTDIYPVAEFKLIEVKALGDRADSCNTQGLIAPTHEVVGDLTIKGITQRVTSLVNLQKQGTKLRVQTLITLDRTQWGIDHLIERENGNKRVLPDMEIIVKVVADALPEGRTSA